MQVVNQSKAKLRSRLHQTNPAIYQLLQKSLKLEIARDRIYTYLTERERDLYNHTNGSMHPLEYASTRDCIRVFKQIIAPRNEAKVEFSTLEHLWRAIRDKSANMNAGFMLEFIHLFKGINKHTHFAEGWLGPILANKNIEAVDFNQVRGRRAGKQRSRFLDAVSREMWSRVARFPSGLEPALVAKRKANKQRIVDFFDATPGHWNNFAWQLKNIITGSNALSTLDALVPMSDDERKAVRLCTEHGIPFGITPYYLSLFDFDSADWRQDASIRAQVIPPMSYVEDMITQKEDREYACDFMREHDTSPVDLVTRRYAAIAILKAYDTCPQICVYCQRNWSITGPMAPGASVPTGKLDAALDWFARHEHIHEVLITGGDPFFISDQRIDYIMQRLAAIDHITNIRWGTRALVTMPMRVTDKLVGIISRYIEPGNRNVAVVTHIEAPSEITPEVAAAVHRLRQAGIRVYNQQVFTVHNSRRFQTTANRVAMKKIGIDPYYTFYPKGKEETRDYRTPLARILQERKEEARLLPGTFRTDEPVFNVPRLGKNHVRAWQDRELIAIRPDGRRVYLWHPWEKGITSVEPWLYADSSILDYLLSIAKLGEDPEEYQSIWYYF